MKTLSLSTPYFIRCIKSNNEKIADCFDDNIILRQLRYTGMLETVRIRRAGYPIRIQYEAFIDQYKILLANGRNSTRVDVEKFFNEHPLIENESVQYGRTKIYMRDAEKLLLDDHLHRVIMQKIVTLQQWVRAKQTRRRFMKFRQGIIRLQARVRGKLTFNRCGKIKVFRNVCQKRN